MIESLIGNLYRFRGQIVKVRWVTGDDEWQLTDYGEEFMPGQDEPGVFILQPDGKEEFFAVLAEDNGELFDIRWDKTPSGGSVVVKTVKGNAAELEPIDEPKWIDEVLR